MEVVYFKSQHLPHQEICRVRGLTGNTLRTYLRAYQAGGIEQLKQLNCYRPQRRWRAPGLSLEASFQAPPPATIKQARSLIAAQTASERSPPQVRNFLLHLGLRCRRVGRLPAQAAVEKQAAFLAQELQPRLAAASAGQRKVFLVDAAPFVLAPFLGFRWSLTRDSCPKRTPTLQCAGCAGRRQQRDFPGDQADLHHLGAGLRVADPIGSGQHGAPAHGHPGQCQIPALPFGADPGGELRA